MLRWAIILLAVAIIAWLAGFAGLFMLAGWIVRLLFVVFLAVFFAFLVFGILEA